MNTEPAHTTNTEENMTPTRCHTPTPSADRLRALFPFLRTQRSEPPGKQGFLPTTSIATPRGWQSASSILPGDKILTPSGAQEEVLDVQLTTLDPHELFDTPQDWPVLIPSYALGNLSELVVLPDQGFQIPKSVMGVQHLTAFGKATARDLVGLNEIRTVDPEEVQTAITLIFEEETVVSCAHGGLAVCNGAHDATQSNWPALLAA